MEETGSSNMINKKKMELKNKSIWQLFIKEIQETRKEPKQSKHESKFRFNTTQYAIK